MQPNDTDLSQSGFLNGLPQFTKWQLLQRSFIGLVSFVILNSVANSFVEKFLISAADLSATGLYLLQSQIFYPLAIVLSIICFYPRKKVLIDQLTSLSFTRMVKHTAILVLVNFFFSLLANIFFCLENRAFAIKLVSQFSGFRELFSFSLIFFIQWILVGVGEEIIFRGGIYRGLRSILPQFASIIIMSLIFVAMHEINFYSSIFLFLYAGISAYYLEKNNNLLPIMLSHIIQDAYIAGITVRLAAYLVTSF